MNKGDKLGLQRLVVGHFIEKIPDDCTKSVVYVMQGDGIYERRKNRLGIFTTKIADATVPGLDDSLEDGWELAVPLIPVSLLGTAVAFFRKVYTMHRSEAFVQFFYDTEAQEYLLHCPKQTVSGASVKFDRDAAFETPSRILVMEIHSHGNMDAFFSGTDDKDEKDDRFYGVVGKVTDFFPQMKLRLNMGGYVREVDIDDIFDIDEEMYHAETFPDDWPTKVEKKKEEDKKKKGKGKWKRGEDLVVYSGQGDRRQAELFGSDALGTPFGSTDGEDMNRLYEKYLAGDHLCSSYECVKEDDRFPVEEGDDFYVQKDGKFWHVTHTRDGEAWTEVGKEEISQQLYGRLVQDSDERWADEKTAEEEMDQYNQRCEEWLRNVEKEDNMRSWLERDHIPTSDSPDYPHSNDPHCNWRNYKF